MGWRELDSTTSVRKEIEAMRIHSNEQAAVIMILLVAVAVIMQFLTGCTKLEPDTNDPTHAAAWTTTVDCGVMIAHPCPYMTFATLATFYETTTDKLAITWWAIAGAADDGPDEELATFSDTGDILLIERGDSSGERMASTLTYFPDADRYVGDVPWLLYNIAGMTTFHLTIDRVIAP